jgi:hypothetical protein
VEPGTRFFWVLIAALLGASVFFGLNAESRRRDVQASETTLANGAVVSVQRVVDGTPCSCPTPRKNPWWCA